MSKLAKTLPTAETIERERVRKGPAGECEVYGAGDLEDWAAVERLRLATTWATAHREVDKAKNLSKAVDEDRFRYHWRRRCGHWSAEQKSVRLEDLP